MKAFGYLLLEVTRSWFLASLVVVFWTLVALTPILHAGIFQLVPADGAVTVSERLEIDQAITSSLVVGIDRSSLAEVGLAPAEINHLGDVRRVLIGLTIKLVVSLVLLLTIRLDATATRGALGLVALLGLASALAYEDLFLFIHRLFFLDGTWIFSPDHYLITQVYPFQFFAWLWSGILGLSLTTVGAVHAIIRVKE